MSSPDPQSSSASPVVAFKAPPPPARTLTHKLAEVMEAVGRVPKRGFNEHFKYKFAREADVVAECRKHLARLHVMLYPEVLGERRVEVGKTSSGTPKILTQLEMRFTFIDGDTNETLVRQWLGSGMDSEDKGVPKALTGAEKYFLMKTFLIDTGDDPEATDAQGRSTARPAPRDRPAPARPAASVPHQGEGEGELAITDAQVTRLKGLLKEHNVDLARFGRDVKAKFGYASLKQIHRRHYDLLCRAVVEGIDVQTGETGADREPGSDDQ